MMAWEFNVQKDPAGHGRIEFTPPECSCAIWKLEAPRRLNRPGIFPVRTCHTHGDRTHDDNLLPTNRPEFHTSSTTGMGFRDGSVGPAVKVPTTVDVAC